MQLLMENHPGLKVLLLGNEAILRGAFEAGLEVATAYPGTPSSEIPDTLFPLAQRSNLYFEYSTNEKVALEVAAGAAIAGMRSLCTMKHVGLNVAADPLNTLSYTGVKAGMVVLTAGEPSMHSSQNEQDNRFFTKLSLLPMIEPSTPAEGLVFTREAFAISEEIGLPVLLRTTTRMNHSRGVVEFGELRPRRFQGHFDKDAMRWVPVPLVARRLRIELLAKQETAYEAIRARGFDFIEGEGKLGIITSGVSYLYVKELIEELSLTNEVKILRVASCHPLPKHKIEEILKSSERLLVVEELEPFLEESVRALAQRFGVTIPILGKGTEWIPRHFELSPDRIRPAIAQFAGISIKKRVAVQMPELPPRPPTLCAGCPHRASYYAVKSIADPDTYFASDIGCYTLGLLPPLNITDSFLCMGSSITMASGVTINNPQKHVAFIGDSTFFHSGLTGLVNAVHNKHDLLLIILDNSTTAMTGHQPDPRSDIVPEIMTAVEIERAVRGMGANDVTIVDPSDLKKMITVVTEAYHRKGVRVIIASHPCPLFARRILKEKRPDVYYRVDPEKCRRCGRTGNATPCSVPSVSSDDLSRARQKIVSSDLDSMDFPASEPECKQDTPACTSNCPAGICVSGYVNLARVMKFDEALALIREQTAFPGVLGRVCHHPCEKSCLRGDYDASISINAIKRFVADRESGAHRKTYLNALRERAEAIQSGRRVAIIGAGPAGLTAAHDLTLLGHKVTIFEREHEPGGLLLLGIPEYRLPRSVLGREIEGVLTLGIELKTGVSLGEDFTIAGLLKEGFEAVCLATGAHIQKRLAIPDEKATGIEGALDFLKRVNLKKDPRVGKEVVVVGGGNAAVDAARTAIRLGARRVQIVYRRGIEEMPAVAEEVQAAREEGIELLSRFFPTRFLTREDKVEGVICLRTKPGERDLSGRARPVPIPKSEIHLVADHVIVAIGQSVDTEMLPDASKHPEIFLAGDVTSEGWTVVSAIASAKKAATEIDLFLKEGASPSVGDKFQAQRALKSNFHPPKVPWAKRAEEPQLSVEQRVTNFEEARGALSEEQVAAEAARCLSCGRCARCENCTANFGCPAFYRKDGFVHIDEVICTGCGICAQLCPNDAIFPVSKEATKQQRE